MFKATRRTLKDHYRKIVGTLGAGGCIGHPTDTFWPAWFVGFVEIPDNSVQGVKPP